MTVNTVEYFCDWCKKLLPKRPGYKVEFGPRMLVYLKATEICVCCFNELETLIDVIERENK